MKLTREMSITEVLNALASTTYIESDGLWYDWFCRESALKNRAKTLLGKLRVICKVNNGKFDPSKCYVFFKNNCPLHGSLYDDFRICDLETHDVLFTVVPKSGFYCDDGAAILSGIDSDGNFQELVKGSWTDVKNYFAS